MRKIIYNATCNDPLLTVVGNDVANETENDIEDADIDFSVDNLHNTKDATKNDTLNFVAIDQGFDFQDV